MLFKHLRWRILSSNQVDNLSLPSLHFKLLISFLIVYLFSFQILNKFLLNRLLWRVWTNRWMRLIKDISHQRNMSWRHIILIFLFIWCYRFSLFNNCFSSLNSNFRLSWGSLNLYNFLLGHIHPVFDIFFIFPLHLESFKIMPIGPIFQFLKYVFLAF